MTTVKLAFIAIYLEVISTRICGSKAARERDFRAKNNSDVNTRLFQIRTRVWKSKICTKYLRLHFLYKENHTTVSMWMKFPRNSSFFPSHFFGGFFFLSERCSRFIHAASEVQNIQHQENQHQIIMRE